jgi:hypothetical protein
MAEEVKHVPEEINFSKSDKFKLTMIPGKFKFITL